MKVLINANDVTLTDALKQDIETKMKGLIKFYGQILTIEVNLHKESHLKKNGRIYRVDVDLHIPKDNIHVQSQQEDIGAAINEVKNELARVLKKKKGKESDVNIKKGRELMQKEHEVNISLENDKYIDEYNE